MIIPAQDCRRWSSPVSEGALAEWLLLMTKVAPPTSVAAPAVDSMRASLRRIVERIPRLRDKGTRISEQDTKRVLITPIVEALGWAIYDTDEVRNEYRHASADNPVDYALFLNRSPVLFIEAKPVGQGLDDRKWLLQTLNYANAAGVDWCVLTNGVAVRLYKVHAQVEAEQKLFASVSLEDPAAFDGAIRVLGLLTRDNMRARAIDDLWQAWHVDRQVKAALEIVMHEDAFLRLIGKRVPQIALAELKRSLQRANLSVDYPNPFADAPTEVGGMPTIAVPQIFPPPVPAGDTSIVDPPLRDLTDKVEAVQDLPPADRLRAVTVTDVSSSGSNTPRRKLQSIDDLFGLGRLHCGDILTIRGHANSSARVMDGRSVEFGGERVSFLEWGKRVTGWKAIQIYTAARLSDGRTLDELRDEPQAGSTAK